MKKLTCTNRLASTSRVLLVFLLSHVSCIVSQQTACPSELAEQYKPCSCVGLESVDGSVNVSCILRTNEEIKAVFNNAPDRVINLFSLVPAPENNLLIVGADLLADKQARSITIASCPSLPSGSLEIDLNAFRYSKDSVQEFNLLECFSIDLLNWKFLQDFDQLTTLRLDSVNNIQSIDTLPVMKNLEQLSIASCTGLGHPLIKFPGTSFPALKRLILKVNNDLTDRQAEEILSSLEATAENLEELNLSYTTAITKVPDAVSQFSGLVSIDMSFNSIQTISSTDFNFSSNPAVRLLNLENNQVSSIEKDSFTRGNYGRAKLRLNNNRLTDFGPEIFLELLNEMENSNHDGQIDITGNNDIECSDCQLAWLIRDNRPFLEDVSGGVCSNGVSFEDFDPNDYDDACASFTTTTTTPSTITAPTTARSTTTTASSSTSSTPTTSQSTTTRTTATTITPNPSTGSNSQNENETLIYVGIGLVGLILIILIIGFIYMICTKKSRRKRVESIVSISPEVRQAPPPPIEKRNYPPATQSYPAGSAQVMPTQPPKIYRTAPVVQIPRPSRPSSSVLIVKGPGGKYYAQSTTGSLNASALMQQQSYQQGAPGLRRSYY